MPAFGSLWRDGECEGEQELVSTKPKSRSPFPPQVILHSVKLTIRTVIIVKKYIRMYFLFRTMLVNVTSN